MKRLSLLVAVVVASLALLAVRSLLPAPSPNIVVIDPPRPLPDIAVADGKGKSGSPTDFRSKYVLLNVWATWCVPCRKEMPTLDRLEAKLGSPDFEVVALSIDRGGAEAVRKFYADIGIRNLAVNVDAKGEERPRHSRTRNGSVLARALSRYVRSFGEAARQRGKGQGAAFLRARRPGSGRISRSRASAPPARRRRQAVPWAG
jgi:thiol-disulfide isomerase/thioredoxin